LLYRPDNIQPQAELTGIDMHQQFLEDVKRGLTSSPKFLSSKYFYDKTGDKLFQEIMALDEYYLTDCEYEIFSTHKESLLKHFVSECDQFHLVEFGAGDALKTKVLLHCFMDRKAAFEYNPIDISGSAIDQLKADLGRNLPELSVVPMNQEYFEAVERIGRSNTCKKVILFLGSNIGNFTEKEADRFFSRLGDILQSGDQLLTGFDLKKDPKVILAAYNDPGGVTRNFNLNLLDRINRELDADFQREQFYHYPVYDPVDGAAKSYLISCKRQQVRIGANPTIIDFEKDEPIFMEVSQKYSLEDIENYAARAGFHVTAHFFDNRKYFVNSLWEIH
jgi:dimethylhistidine N-methyltransferase